MDDSKTLFEGLLKADGINPADVPDAERAVFREMLDSEQKRVNRLSWRVTAMYWIYLIALLGLCFFGDSLERLGIPFIVSFFVVVASVWVVLIRYWSRHHKMIKESNKKISKLYYLVHGKHRGFPLIGKKNGKRFFYWPRIIIIAAALWLVMSLGGAGVYYLLCQHWIYSSGPGFHIFLCTITSLSFVIFILHGGYKTPLDELTEIKAKRKQRPKNTGSKKQNYNS